MATLTIGDKKINIDDGFLKLAPDDQQRAVDEIAGQLEPSLGESIAKGFQNIVPEVQGYFTSQQGMPLDQAVAKARSEADKAIGANEPPILPGTNVNGATPVTSIIPEAIQPENLSETWKGVKNYIATKPIESIGQAVLAATPMKGLGLAEKAAAGAERVPLYDIEGVPFTRADAPLAKPMTPLEAGTAMKAEGGSGIQASKDSGALLPVSEAQGLLDRIKADTESEYNPYRHTSAKAFFDRFQGLLPKAEINDDTMIGGKRLGDLPQKTQERIKALAPPEASLTVKDLHNMRQDLNDVLKSPYEQEKRLAGKAKDALDDTIVQQMDQGHWTQDMQKYAIGSTVQELSRIADRAQYRTTQLQAGNKEQALNTEFRQWARPKPNGTPNRNMRMLRALSPDAADQMESFVKDKDPARKLLRGLGSMAPRNIQSFSWDHIGALLFHTVLGIHLNPYMLMGIGAGAKYLAGGMAEKSLQGIQRALLDAEKMSDVGELISQPVLAATAKQPAGRQALRMWANAKGPAKKYAASVLARQIAMAAKAPQHVPRIEKEINDLGGSDIPKTNKLETRY